MPTRVLRQFILRGPPIWMSVGLLLPLILMALGKNRAGGSVMVGNTSFLVPKLPVAPPAEVISPVKPSASAAEPIVVHEGVADLSLDQVTGLMDIQWVDVLDSRFKESSLAMLGIKPAVAEKLNNVATECLALLRVDEKARSRVITNRDGESFLFVGGASNADVAWRGLTDGFNKLVEPGLAAALAGVAWRQIMFEGMQEPSIITFGAADDEVFLYRWRTLEAFSKGERPDYEGCSPECIPGECRILGPRYGHLVDLEKSLTAVSHF